MNKNKNKKTKMYKLLECVLYNRKREFIWKQVVLTNVIMGLGLLVLFEFMFDESGGSPINFLINTAIKMIIVMMLSIIQGHLSFGMYKEIVESKVWTTSLKWKYAFSEGAIGWGSFCGVITMDTFDKITAQNIVMGIGNVLIFTLVGMAFGGIMRMMWLLDDIEKICKSIKKNDHKE